MTSLSQHRRSLGAASIIKQGYLKKLPNAAKPGAKFKVCISFNKQLGTGLC